MLSSGGHTIMAGAASAQHMQVLNLEHGHPRRRVVARFADVRRKDVRRAFPRRVDAVMATEAVVNDAGMVEHCRSPCRCAVTIIALVGAGEVIRRFARRVQAVMTRDTAAGQGDMIDKRNRRPCRRCMTVNAQFRRGHVVDRLRGGANGAELRVAAYAVGAGAFKIAT